MIAKLIEWCINNRAMVLILTAFLVVAGVWATFNITVDAIPDLSDVQVIIRTEYPGQNPEVVEKQVTYPLTSSMLAVPYAKVVRGYSMFGTSFVYIIFEDGTDIYWARSRVLEQLNSVSGRLPKGVSPQLGPDATGVGWVYEYVLTTGKYCPDHPNGLWHDPKAGKWYAEKDDAPADKAVQRRLAHHRIFNDRNTCPLSGQPLKNADVDLAQLRSIQDWYLRYELASLDGVSEVASLGGFVKQYQVVVDPVKLRAYDMPLNDVMMAVQRSNTDVGGSVIEMSEMEYMVRGAGYLGTLTAEEIAEAKAKGQSVEQLRTQRVLEQLRHVPLGAADDGTPIYLADVADVRIGPDMRRGIADWNGQGEVVSGIIVMRFGENARTTITTVQDKLADLAKGLPPGVAIDIGYDRSDLIDAAVGTLSKALIEEMLVVGLVCILFLLHARSELVAVFVVPTGALVALLVMYLLGINANIMSLGGIAIAIGIMVDSSVVMVENAHIHLDREEDRLKALKAAGRPAVPRPRAQLILEAAVEVGPSLFFSLLVITVSFLPVFVLGEQSGRMFKPLAYTKTFAIAASSILAVTIVPVLMVYFITPRVLPRRWGWKRNLGTTLATMLLPAALLMVIPLGHWDDYRHWIVLGWVIFIGMLLLPQKIIHEHANPISRFLQWIYNPMFVLAMRFKATVLIGALLLLALTLWPLSQLGSEFMPPLEEGDLLYMPTTDPGMSVTKARELLQQTDKLIKQFPEVKSVFGKIGRAESATDPAPMNMIETTITLHRDKSKWRQVPTGRFYSDWPNWLAWLPRKLSPDQRPITLEELVYGYDLPGGGPHVPGLNETVQFPGLTNAWTMPILTRIDMLSTGIKTPVGVKIMGPDLATLANIAADVSQALKSDAGTSAYTTSAYGEKTLGGNYLDILPNRAELARYQLKVDDVQAVILSAVGGMNIGSTVEGIERYPISVRYPHELRDNIDSLRQTLVATPAGAQVPLGQLATIRIHKGPDMIRSENARPSSWVFVDIAGIDVGTYVKNAQKAVAKGVKLPTGYSIVWSGQYEYMQAARAKLMIAVPLALVLIVLLLYVATRSWLRVGIVLLAVPFSLIGAVWLLYLLDYNLSLAVWVGLIGLAGLDAETGMVMLLYLDNSYDRFKAEGRMRNTDDLWHAIHDGAVRRIRPKTMTVLTDMIGLIPLLWATGAGADTMSRLAVPMIGGMTSSFLLELLIYPVLFYMAKRIAMFREARKHAVAEPEALPVA